MRGLIYKDTSIFFKSIDKKLILIAVAAIVLLIFNAGIYAGLFASVMFVPQYVLPSSPESLHVLWYWCADPDLVSPSQAPSLR